MQLRQIRHRTHQQQYHNNTTSIEVPTDLLLTSPSCIPTCGGKCTVGTEGTGDWLTAAADGGGAIELPESCGVVLWACWSAPV